MKKLTLLLVVAMCLTACAELEPRPVPEPYRAQLVALRNSNDELAKKCVDLQKEQAELRAQQTWNEQRMNIIVAQAADSVGISLNEYQVSTAKMMFVPYSASRGGNEH